MTRALLILPTATYRAPEFLDAARRLGVEVVTGSERPQALARTMGDRFIELALDEPERAADTMVELAHRVEIDAVLAVDDQGALAAAHAARRLGLLHNPPDAVAATRDKAVIRERLGSAGVSQPSYRAIARTTGTSTPTSVVEAARSIGYPCVVKPVGLSGSRGVIRVDDDDSARAATTRIERLLEDIGDTDSTLLVEGFVAGEEVAVEGLMSAGALEVLALFDKPDPLDGPYFEETIYVTPSRLAADVQHATAALVEAAAAAIGIAEGPVHAEVRIRQTSAPVAERVVLIELAARTIGGGCTASLHFATGSTLEEIVLAHALGRDLPSGHEKRPGASGVMMLPIPATGRLVAVEGREAALDVAFVTQLDVSIAPGRYVEMLPEGDRYLGFLFAEAPSPAQVEDALHEAHRRLVVRIDPELRARGRTNWDGDDDTLEVAP